jgi:hypothetical protein
MLGMRCAAIGLLVLSAGCATVQSDAPTPPGAAVQSDAPAPPGTAVKAPVKPGPPATAARAAAKPAAAKPAAAKPAAAKPAATLDVAALGSRLRNTSAIGVFTKLALKNQMDDLLQRLRAQHQSGAAGGVAALREPFDLLVLKVLAVVQDGDPALARTVSGSREALWSILADPVKFNALA